MAKQNTELAGIMAWKEAGPVDGQPCCIIDCDLLQQLTAAEGTSTLQHVNMQQHRVAGPATAAIEISVVPSHSGSLSQLQQGPAGVFSSAAVRLSDASFSSSAMGSPQQVWLFVGWYSSSIIVAAAMATMQLHDLHALNNCAQLQ